MTISGSTSPALRKIKRISGSDKEDSFMGTDFTFDDMGDREVEEDTHTRTGQEIFEGKKCYIVESVPKEKNYIYSKKARLGYRWRMDRSQD